ncbi:uncharacterized protein YigE (DUF2233 family) [Rhizobium lusitanum]|uniref:Uncharacterized protein YigE (DUF2233 family) n=1 Tax=Rhizobium lusitanum TaxID=293958 RepID=A0A7X0IY65_9HYPH|nr:uncharacterized protein YigE (DUF2233 family) [Rhizobium lusitanum]
MSKIPRNGSRLQLSQDNAVKVAVDTKSDCGPIDLSDGIVMPAIRQQVAGRMFRDDGLGASRHSFIPVLISR